MSKILSGIFRWLIQKAATLLLILAVLLGVAWIKGELKRAEELGSDRAGLVVQRGALFKQTEELNRNAAERSKKAEAVVRNLESILDRTRADRQKLWDEHFWARKNPLSVVWQKIKLFDMEIVVYQETVNKVTRVKESAEKELKVLVMQKERAIEQIDGKIAGVDEKLDKAFGSRLATVVYQELPIAVGVLLGIILIPIGIKVFLYFIVAPWAAGRPPIRLWPSASGSILAPSVEGTAGNGRGKMSAVSQPIVLAKNQELLIQPEYLQSTSLQAGKKTKWLLNASIPFTSLLSGMFMLTRVGPAGSEPVVISATKDPFSEVGIIDLADGAAFVCQPHSLAGVIQDRSNPMRITRHWRLASLQSWLTLQLRFLVFHGPGQLVMKGCRGIRIESAGMGRLINQAATLGFSANLNYANTRCETFVSYWTGKEDLFNDLFTGEPGVYVYEEMPDLKRTTGITGRGLEGFTDAILKVFGV
ncbi:MAG: hypothetical protein AABM33_02845 [Pseudomonadota bacterium]